MPIQAKVKININIRWYIRTAKRLRRSNRSFEKIYLNLTKSLLGQLSNR